MNQPQENRRLGPYILTRKLGEGGMGAVYLGRHEVLDVDHAIKILPPKLAQNAQFIERFLREARHAARLHHPHIVQVVGADKFGDVRYIAMQFVPGESLEKMVRGRGAMSPWQAMRYCYHVASALHYAHNHGMIHRDVKPDNVLVDESDNARLTDFGLVREMAAAEGAGLTQSGTVLGTPFYMSPEQWKGEGVDHRSDLYAVGVMLYYMMSRRFPYPGEGPAQILRRQIDGDPQMLKGVCPHADDDMCKLVHSIVHVDPAQRPQSASELLERMQAWWDAHPNDEGVTLDTNVGGTVVRTGASATKFTPADSNDTLMEAQGTMASTRPSQAGQSGAGLQFTGPGGGPPPPPPPPGAAMQMSGAGTPPPGGQVVMTDHGPVLVTAGGQSMITIAQDPSQARQMKIWMSLVAVLVIVVAVVLVVMMSRGDGPAAPVAGPELKLEIAADVATETSPLFVNQPKYSIPGTARGTVTLDGNPYELGDAVTLQPGLNKLRIEVVGEDGKKLPRTLYLYLDTMRPSLELPDFQASAGGEMRAKSADAFVLRGNVADDDEQVMVDLKRSADADWETLQLRDGGGFRVPVDVSPEPVSMWLRARDRAGNTTPSLTLIIEFEPPTITSVSVANGETVVVRDPREPVTISGTLNTGAGITLLVNDEDIGATVAADGTFSFSFTPGMAGPAEFTLQPVNRDGRKGKVEKRTLDIRRQIYEPIAEPEGNFPEYRRLTDRMVCVLIPAGTYTRGAPEGLGRGDASAGEVQLSAYLMDKTEVTNGQYVLFLNEAGQMMKPLTPEEVWVDYIDKQHCRLEFDQTSGRWRTEDGFDSRPVVGVTWRGAFLYARWADPYGGSLPSEAQWEVAARGSDGRHYPWGDDPPSFDYVHFLDDGLGDGPMVVTDPKMKAGRSPWGLWMMSGNVEEWCLDYYTVGAYFDATGRDPAVTTAPPDGNMRTVRGGSFQTLDRVVEDLEELTADDSDLCPFFRTRADPTSGAPYRGFRCAATAPDGRDR